MHGGAHSNHFMDKLIARENSTEIHGNKKKSDRTLNAIIVCLFSVHKLVAAESNDIYYEFIM